MSEHSTNNPEVFKVVEHLFRHEGAKMVATLTRIFGIEHLDLAEDVVQEALARALQTWPFYGVPENPAAWIMRASRNLALDTVRREKVFRKKEAEIIAIMERDGTTPEAPIFGDQEIGDDRLRMMFACCHPVVPVDDQVALALKAICGFSPGEIASAFLTSEAAIAKRLTRAKQKIRAAGVSMEIPSGPELAERLDAVLQALYLLFNEGYKASNGDKLVREDICEEAIRLATLLAAHPAGNRSKTHALLALMLLSAARTPSRLDAEGNLLTLKEQNRADWDESMIAKGMMHLAQSASGNEISEYHLAAGIAACHCTARDYAATDWRQILGLYNRLMEFDRSPVVALNRAVALAEVEGAQAGVDAVRRIQESGGLESYYLLYAVLGEFELRLNRPGVASGHFQRALELAEVKSEQALLLKRVRECELKGAS